MSPSRIGTELAAVAACLAVFLGAFAVFGDGLPPLRWVALFVATYLLVTGARLAWRRHRRSGTPPS